MINVYLHSTSGPSGWQLPSFPAVLYHMVNWLAGSDFAASLKGGSQAAFFLCSPASPSPFVSSLPLLHCPMSSKSSPGACVCECVPHKHTDTGSYPLPSCSCGQAFESLLSSWCTCAGPWVHLQGQKGGNGKLTGENQAPSSPGPCPLCLDEISDATGCLVSKSFAKEMEVILYIKADFFSI